MVPHGNEANNLSEVDFIYLFIHIKNTVENNSFKNDKTKVWIEWPTQGRTCH